MKKTALTIFSLLCLASASISYAATFRTVAYSGESSPDVPGGAFQTLQPPSLNNAGQVAVLTSLADGRDGFWSEGSGALHMVALEGNQAAGKPNGVNFFRFNFWPTLNDAGKIAFFGEVANNDGGVWVERNGSLQLVAAKGDLAPGAPAGTKFTFPSPPALNNAGNVEFYSQTDNSVSGYWTDTSGALAAVAVKNNQAPGTPAGAVYNVFNEAAFNNLGRTAFSAFLTEGAGGVTSDNSIGIWSNRNGALILLNRAGDQAPGTPSGANFSSFNGLRFNDAGQIAFQGTLKIGSGGVTANNSSGIWSDRTGPLSLVARRGDQAPGVASGASFFVFQQPVMNSSGQVAFMSSLLQGAGGVTSDNDTGFWSEGGGALSLIAREGDQAPGAPAGAVFGNFQPPLPNGVAFNDAGHVAFRGFLKSGVGGVTFDNDGGLWAQNGAGLLQLIVREGDQLEVTPGDFRTISDLEFFEGVGFNDCGQLAFKANFADGSNGVFVTSVPEPAVLAILFSGLPLLLIGRRRHALDRIWR